MSCDTKCTEPCCAQLRNHERLAAYLRELNGRALMNENTSRLYSDADARARSEGRAQTYRYVMESISKLLVG